MSSPPRSPLPVSSKQEKSPHCQCRPDCPHPPLPDSSFCSRHQRSCPRRAPLTGSEPDYEPNRYNKYRGIKESHNCYTYALNYLHLPKDKRCTKTSCPLPYPQPGRASGYPKWSNVKGKRCPDLISRIVGDIPGASVSTFEQRCPTGKRKIAVVADEDEDYHFYRQDSNGYWSHKPGATDVIRRDASDRLIYDPELASRYYPKSGLHYDQFCSYLCIPATKKHRLKRGGTHKRKMTKKQKKQKKQKAKIRKSKKSRNPIRLENLMV